ncbi:unnamed protein product [Spirodela intermedia]|uniref:Uncharacterized protein n=1 Tax=Spirodela intermedia TaxID=51605 RepID=A0A7I8IRJ5_SPIIN|nr:unnamed protein product [Spirodela intermedia]CAA6660483.1 unnamed protein product [Spirodela intermedia]
MGTKARTERWMKLWSAAGGRGRRGDSSVGPILLSMVLPCLVKKVDD